MRVGPKADLPVPRTTTTVEGPGCAAVPAASAPTASQRHTEQTV